MLASVVVASWLVSTPPPPGPPAPTGAAAPPELADKITLGLNLTLFVVLAVCFGMALWGLGSMAWSKKKQNFGGVNEGQSMVVLALAGAAGTTGICGVVGWLGG